ncbi:MAG: aromatic acid exporter family protein [Solirubrobacteraceae bacterium]
MFEWIAHRLRDPVSWSNASQLAKTVLAAVAAWVLAVDVLHLSQAFMAPWAALLTVQTTVFGTVRGGRQQAAASVLGVLIAFGAWRLLGLNAASLGLAVLAGLIVGSIRGVRAETTTAATALVVLTTGYLNNGNMLVARLEDTGIGIAVGLLVNLLVWPPLRDRSAARQIDVIDDRVGQLLADMAEQFRHGSADPDDWIARTSELGNDVNRAWRVLEEARESGRFNPRRATAGRMNAAEEFAPILNRLDQAIAETRSMVRTIRLARVAPEQWDRRFREPWLDLLGRSGTAVVGADIGKLTAARTDLSAFADRLEIDQLNDLWPVYGALLVNLRNVMDALGAVVEAQPVQVPSPSWPAQPPRLPGA